MRCLLEILRGVARIAFVDIADPVEWDEDGTIALKASAAISPDDRAAIAELKVKRGEHDAFGPQNGRPSAESWPVAILLGRKETDT